MASKLHNPLFNPFNKTDVTAKTEVKASVTPIKTGAMRKVYISGANGSRIPVMVDFNERVVLPIKKQ